MLRSPVFAFLLLLFPFQSITFLALPSFPLSLLSFALRLFGVNIDEVHRGVDALGDEQADSLDCTVFGTSNQDVFVGGWDAQHVISALDVGVGGVADANAQAGDGI